MYILLTIAYDGSIYAGWQRQENAITIQEKLEDALSTLIKRPIQVKGASRTDAGVHAMGQRASFFAPDLLIPLNKLPMVLNGILPSDISVTDAIEVDESFNPRFDAKHKTYNYNIYNATYPNPLQARYSTFIPHNLKLPDMQKAAQQFIGRHDFSAFCATGSNAKTTIREIYSCDIENKDDGNKKGENSNLISISITGNAFLYNMVRIIAGTIVYVGLGKIPHYEIGNIIKSNDRTKAGKTMPPQGLILMDVCY